MPMIQELAALPLADLEQRASETAVRAQELLERPQFLGRDMTADEVNVLHAEKAELEQLRCAIALAEEREGAGQAATVQERAGQIHSAMSAAQGRGRSLSPLLPSAANVDILERARRSFHGVGTIEDRSALTTAEMGTAVEYGPAGLMAPRSLWRSSGIPTVEPPAGYAATVPQFTIPSGTSLVAEGSDHAEFDDVQPDTVQLARTGAWSDASAEAMISSSVAEISQAHARIMARDADLALITKLEGGDSGLSVDEAMLTVADTAAVDVSSLWIVGPVAELAALVGNAVFTPTSGPDVESFASRYGGAAVYVSAAASAVTVFSPQGFRAFATPLGNAVVVNPQDGSVRFGSWMMLGFGQVLAGAALTVGGSSS